VKLEGRPSDQSSLSAVMRLRMFHTALRDRAIPLGAISAGDRDRLWERHIADSLRALRCLSEGDRLVMDLGSGAGLPGIPMAIAEPTRRFVLVERNRKKAGFLELLVDTLDLENVSVDVRSIEDVAGLVGDVCVARALAGPTQSWSLARRLLGPEGRLLYFAGRSWAGGEPTRGAKGPVGWQVCAKSHFDWQGPIVMMTRTM
jgi:16S rRNA (guanine527-N7)-methyltransferase